MVVVDRLQLGSVPCCSSLSGFSMFGLQVLSPPPLISCDLIGCGFDRGSFGLTRTMIYRRLLSRRLLSISAGDNTSNDNVGGQNINIRRRKVISSDRIVSTVPLWFGVEDLK